MAGSTRTLQFSEGVSTAGPTTTFLQTTQFATYADDATYVTNKGSAAADGDAYYNTTSDVIRVYADGSWQTVFDDSDTNVALLSGTQTFSGAKTFSSAVTISDSTSTTSKDTGSLVVEGGIGVEENVYIGGDLTVDGTTTTINTATLDVEDANITVNKGGNQSTADSNDAGLTVEMSDATDCLVHYDSTATSKWKAGESGSTKEVVTISDTQQLTNKDIDGGTASNTLRITLPKNTSSNLSGLTRKKGTIVYDTDLEKPFYDDGINLNEIGGGSGSINYIDNPNAEGGIANYSTFDDSTAYVDGTGGTASNLAFTQNSSSPLRGNADFDLVVAAADASYEGVSTDFTIDKADKYSVLSISFDYFTDAPDDFFSVRIYDVTNTTIVYPTPQDVKASSVEAKFVSQFQASDSTSYRISLFVNSTDATGYTINWDNLTVGPDKKLVGTPITDWESYTPSTVGLTIGNGTLQGFWRRKGDSIDIAFYFKLGSSSAVTAAVYFGLPSGLSVDSSKNTTQTTNSAIELLDSDTSANRTIGIARASGGYIAAISSDLTGLSATNPFNWAENDVIAGMVKDVPIAGWGSNVKMADIDTNRITALITSKAAPTLISGTLAAGSALYAFDVVKDTHGAYATGTGKYTCPSSGFYRVRYVGRLTGSGTGGYYTSKIIQTGSVTKTYVQSFVPESQSQGNNNTFMVESIFDAVKGDTIFPNLECNFTSGALVSDISGNYFLIEKINGPNTVFGSEIVSLRYSTDSAQEITTATTTNILYDTKDHDTHSFFNTGTGVATMPCSGKFFVDAYARYDNFAWTAGGSANIGIEHNGTAIATMVEEFDVSYTTTRVFKVSLSVDVVQGDTIEITTYQSTGSSIYLTNSLLQNYLSIFKIG